ncbi:MAG: riboflavin synthase [Bacteriovoracaceae bacterium]|nr:riboflavin synthase [Bacteriovoracaceae bacterium]
MFTGLIQQIGTVKNISENAEGRIFEVEFKNADELIKIDDSVSINGVCQTAIKVNSNSVCFQAVHTTLEKTNLGKLKLQDKVNTELAMRVGDRLGGHIVQGHVNSVGKITQISNTGENYIVTINYPDDLTRYFVSEGSVCVDGISLTIAEHLPQKNEFILSIIPHTWKETILQFKQSGDNVNIEVDILAKYVENMINYGNKKQESSKITMGWLSDQGY